MKDGWNAFWGFARPEFHKHITVENNYDFEEQNKRIELIIRENEDLRVENKRLTAKLKEAVDRNRFLESTIDNYGTIFEIMMTYISDDDARRRINAILTQTREERIDKFVTKSRKK